MQRAYTLARVARVAPVPGRCAHCQRRRHTGGLAASPRSTRTPHRAARAWRPTACLRPGRHLHHSPADGRSVAPLETMARADALTGLRAGLARDPLDEGPEVGNGHVTDRPGTDAGMYAFPRSAFFLDVPRSRPPRRCRTGAGPRWRAWRCPSRVRSGTPGAFRRASPSGCSRYPQMRPQTCWMATDSSGHCWTVRQQKTRFFSGFLDVSGLGWIRKWWLWVESNHRPRDYESRALTV